MKECSAPEDHNSIIFCRNFKNKCYKKYYDNCGTTSATMLGKTLILFLALTIDCSFAKDNDTSEKAIADEVISFSSTFAYVENTTDTPSGEKQTKGVVEKPFLLPLSLRPLKYKLEVIPLLWSFENFTSSYYNVELFSAPGKVWIEIICLEETTNITLHAAKDMQIDPTLIQISNKLSGLVVPFANVTRDNDTDFIVIHLERPLNNNETYVVFVDFVARIADDRLNGMYLDYYINPGTKEKRYLSTTLFAPNHARKAFPCFDEPGFKARFTIRIGRKNNTGYSSISNMPLVKTTHITYLSSDWVWDEFEETIPLPTYLVAMITTDFESRSIQEGNLALKLHAPGHLLNRLQTWDMTPMEHNSTGLHDPYLLQDPLRFIAAALRMWKHTKLGGFPLRKVDIIALPHFFFNAMENMGAITFKYPVILNVQNSTTNSELLRLSFVAAHEVVHQWFGNILTPSSWTHVWLKESFSDLFGRIFLSSKMNSEYKHEDFVVSELQRAMRFDGGLETHPLENHIETASDVGGIYTDIPYRKGASILNMIQTFLSKDVFVEALEGLFVESQYSNIEQNDLFRHLQKSQQRKNVLLLQGLPHNVSVMDILNLWTQQSSYPVVRVRKEGSFFVVHQEKYRNRLTESVRTNDTRKENATESKRFKDGVWWIPLPFYNTQNAKSSSVHNYSIKWLPPSNEEARIPLGTFYSFTNVEGYFRILYDRGLLHTILKDLTRVHLSKPFGAFTHSHTETNQCLRPVDRSQLLDDYFTFAFAKYDEVPVSLLLHILSVTMPYEQDYVVWSTFFQNMQKPYKLFQKTDHFSTLQDYLKTVVQPVYHFLSSQKQSTLMIPCTNPFTVTNKMNWNIFHSKVLAWVCRIDEEKCAPMAKQAVQIFVETEDISVIIPDEQEILYCAAVKFSEREELATFWTFFEKMYFHEYYPVQRDRYLKALSCARDKDYLIRLLNWTTNATLDFHDIDRVTLLKNVIANPQGRDIILDFLDRNVKELYKSESVANPVTEAFKAMVDYVNSKDKLAELQGFMEKHKDVVEKKKKFLEKQIKNAKLNVLWMETFAQDVQANMVHQLQTKLSTDKPVCYTPTSTSFEDYISEITDPGKETMITKY